MINIHDLVPQSFLTEWQGAASTGQQDSPSLDWLPYFYQAQLDMTASNGEASGDVLYFPMGVYYMGATLHILRGVHILGEGIGNTIISIHVNDEPIFFEDGETTLVPQDGIILHFPGADQLIGKDFKKFIPPFPSTIDAQTQKDLIIDVIGGNNSSGFGAVIEKVTLNGNNEMRHGVVKHIPGTIQDCEIHSFQGNGVHLFAHVHGRHDLALLYGKLPDGTVTLPNHNHPDAVHGTANPFNIPRTLNTTIDIRPQFAAYMIKILKADGYTDDNLPDDETLLNLFNTHQASNSPNKIVFSIDEIRTEITQGLSLDQEEPPGKIDLIYDGSYTELGNKKLYLTFAGEFKYINPDTNKATTITYIEGIDFLITFSFFHEDYNFPFVRTNASSWRVFRSTIRNCGRHGLYTFNLDANAGMAQAVSCLNNGEFGFFDDSNLGNTYLGCYAAGNGMGNYWSGLADSAVNVSYFIGCHSDNSVPSRIGKPGVVIGGNIKADRPEPEETGKAAMLLEDTGTFNLMSMLRFMSYNGATLGEADRHTYMEFGRDGFKTLFSFVGYDVVKKENNTGWQLVLRRFEGTDEEWNVIASNNQPQYHRMAFAGHESQHSIITPAEIVPVEEGSLWFQNGYYLTAHNNYKTDGYIKVNSTVADTGNPEQPKMTTVIGLYPSTDLYPPNSNVPPRRPKKGDILFNSTPSLGAWSGWICVTDYVDEFTREEWKPFGKIIGNAG